MHNITTIICNRSCSSCRETGFFSATPGGGDHTSCGVCGDYCEADKTLSKMNLSSEEYKSIRADRSAGDDGVYKNKRLLNYCSKCRILVFLGCTHGVFGCTDDIYNTHFISEWVNKKTGEKFSGMPQFDDNQDWFDHVNDVQILKYYCPNKNSICPNSYDDVCK